jgi:hypothetical protein
VSVKRGKRETNDQPTIASAGKIPQKYLRLALSYLKKTDGDRQLSAEEWSKRPGEMGKSHEVADTDGDGHVTLEELGRSFV